MAELDKPPTSNTGALNTIPNRVLLDWCGFTVFDENHAFVSLGIEKDQFCALENGAMGYRKSYVLGHIKVFYDGTVEMGCHVEMSGQACREWEALNLSWLDLFVNVMKNGKFTRLDLALDDFNKCLKLTTMEAKVRRGSVRSVFKKARSVKEYLLLDGSYTGKTLYFGSASSRVQIRVYDKTLEQLSKGKEDVPENWVRIEMQCRDERAQAIATYLIFNQGKSIGSLYKSFLKTYLNFLIRDRFDSNKSRWLVCEWWTKFLDNLEGLPLTISPKPRTMERINHWLHSQVSASLAIVSSNSRGELTNLMNVINLTNAGASKLKQKDYDFIRNYESQIKLKKAQLNAIGTRKQHKLQRRLERKRYNICYGKIISISPFASGVTFYKIVQKKDSHL